MGDSGLDLWPPKSNEFTQICEIWRNHLNCWPPKHNRTLANKWTSWFNLTCNYSPSPVTETYKNSERLLCSTEHPSLRHSKLPLSTKLATSTPLVLTLCPNLLTLGNPGLTLLWNKQRILAELPPHCSNWALLREFSGLQLKKESIEDKNKVVVGHRLQEEFSRFRGVLRWFEGLFCYQIILNLSDYTGNHLQADTGTVCV